MAYGVLVSVSTLFFLPRKRITEEHVEHRRQRRRRSTMKNMNDVTKQMLEKTNDGQRKQHLSEEVFCNPIFLFVMFYFLQYFLSEDTLTFQA